MVVYQIRLLDQLDLLNHSLGNVLFRWLSRDRSRRGRLFFLELLQLSTGLNRRGERLWEALVWCIVSLNRLLPMLRCWDLHDVSMRCCITIF